MPIMKKHLAILNYCVKHIKIYKKRHFAKASDYNQDVTVPDKKNSWGDMP